uniref:Uncharacterized protein n=1 Tax=Glossina pallidipes TaxID=7398 RepID=A0A1B0ADG8_GLOPL
MQIILGLNGITYCLLLLLLLAVIVGVVILMYFPHLSESKHRRTAWVFQDKSKASTFSVHEDIRYAASLALENRILFIQLLVCLRNLQRRNERLRSTANHSLLTRIQIRKIDIFKARTDVDLAIN